MAVLFAMTVAIGITSGCAGSPKQVAYKTLKSVGDGVDSAMKAAAEAKVKGVLPQDDWDRIARLHDRYRTAFAKAVEAAHFNYEAAAPGEVAGLAAELTAEIAQYIH